MMEFASYTSRGDTSARLRKAARARVRHVLTHVPRPRGTGEASVGELRSVLAEVSHPVLMSVRPRAGSSVGTGRLANRSGGKRRGVKGHDPRKGNKKVNVSKL